MCFASLSAPILTQGCGTQDEALFLSSSSSHIQIQSTDQQIGDKRQTLALVNGLTFMLPPNVKLNPKGTFWLIVLIGLFFFYAFSGFDLFTSEQKVSLKELLCVSIDAATTGGKEVRVVYEQHNMTTLRKANNEPVTEADKISHRNMFYLLQKSFPGVLVISEEHDIQPVDLKTIPDPKRHRADVDEVITSDYNVNINDVTIWIDPLDATQEFTEGLTEYVTVMVCVAVYGEPKIGVIYQPFTERVYWGMVGYGTSTNFKSVTTDSSASVDSPTNINSTRKRFIVSRSHKGKVRQVVDAAFGAGQSTVTSAGGAGFKMLQVAALAAQDYYVHVTNIKKWDICAPDAIIRSVGGQLSTIKGDEITYGDRNQIKVTEGIVAALKGRSEAASAISKTIERLKSGKAGGYARSTST